MNTRIKQVAWTLSLLLAGCEPNFDPYNELSGMRVLALRAEPPEIKTGESTTLDALFYNDTKQTITMQWSVCPWPSDPNGGFACLVDQTLFDQAWRQAGLEGEALDLSLSTSEAPQLSFPGNAEQARALCQALASLVGSAATALPDCDARWEWTVRLEAAAGSYAVDTVKPVTLLLSESEVPNHNPTLTELGVERDSKLVTLDAAEPVELKADSDHKLRVQVAADAVETYLPVLVEGEPPKGETREALTFTWFVDQGSTERMRSTYKEGVESLDEASRNEWYAPKKAKPTRILVVVRDHRGGVDWREGRVQLTD